jgi:hypothetical protein
LLIRGRAAKRKPGTARDAKALRLQAQRLPVDLAVMVQHFEQGVAGAQVFAHQRVAPDLQRLAVLAQHQAGR